MMKYLMTALVALSMYVPIYAVAAPLSGKEVATLLNDSVVAIVNGNLTVCTASKIGDHQYITAKHCVQGDFHFYTANKKSLFWKSVMETVQKKDAKRFEDWAIVNTIEDDTAVKPLALSCSEEPYLTQEVAYGGFPYPTNYVVTMGRVTTLKPMVEPLWSLDIGIDNHAAPGASGSPIISLDTGKVLGILVEMIVEERAGAYMYGFERISNVDACDTLKGVKETSNQLPASNSSQIDER